ncbi:unnamed protein product [Didymodactylos carnosus]|uniref:Hyccin n=1 Tax=Didymodactylos carnosus TaxID=1234261 RepID=A0A814MCY1_9BILA|nr:unnamed protein product [Didymodactylos carnosus]CAF3843074.1 unnamed protein product [Didymodactylos carnosus]
MIRVRLEVKMSASNININVRQDSLSFDVLDEWLTPSKAQKSSSLLMNNPHLSQEIHSAIVTERFSSISSICNQLFQLYRDSKARSFVLQFLPTFLSTYYDVLYEKDEETKGVVDDAVDERVHEFRVPNLASPSIYHVPNPDQYAHTPLTQNAISKHEKICEIIRLQTFIPFDSVNATTREQIMWFLLIQYGMNISLMDDYSRYAYLSMCKKLIGQGFNFNDDNTNSSTEEERPQQQTQSILPPTGRRIPISSRIMTEILGSLYYFKANYSDKDVGECMRLLKHRADYEMYPDVILMTESMACLHEFETQRYENNDTMGIPLEVPPTADVVKQKRSATTARSMKIKQKHHHRTTTANTTSVGDIEQSQQDASTENTNTDTIEYLNFVPAPSEASATDIQLSPSPSAPITNPLENQSPTTINKIFSPKNEIQIGRFHTENVAISNDDNNDVIYPSSIQTTTMSLPQKTTRIASSIGLAKDNSSPKTTQRIKPSLLTSSQQYYNSIQQQQFKGTSAIISSKQIIHESDNDNEQNNKMIVTNHKNVDTDENESDSTTSPSSRDAILPSPSPQQLTVSSPRKHSNLSTSHDKKHHHHDTTVRFTTESKKTHSDSCEETYL